MQSSDLTAEQIEALQQKLLPAAVFLKSLAARIEQQQFPQLDPLRMRTLIALDQLEALQQVLEHLAKDRTTRDTYLLGCRSEREYKRKLRENR